MRLSKETLMIGVLLAIGVAGWLWLSRGSEGGRPGGISFGVDNRGPATQGGTPAAGRQRTPTPTPEPTMPVRFAATPLPAPTGTGRPQAAFGPVIMPSAAQIVLGTQIVIAGQDFPPKGLATVVLQKPSGDAEVIAEGLPIDRDGRFSLPFEAAENMAAGDYMVIASAGGPEARAPLHVSGRQPVAEVNVPAAKPGDPLNLLAGGFAPGEDVEVRIDTLNSPPFVTLKADGSGTVSARGVAMPFTAEGDHFLVFVGSGSHNVARAQLNAIGFYPWVTLSSYASQPGIAIDFEGHNFAPAETIWVFLDDWGPSHFQQIRTDDKGDFLLKKGYVIPADLQGDHKFLFVGELSQKQTEAGFTALPFGASIQLSVWAGKAGTRLTIDGKAFAPGEKVDVYWGAPENKVLLATFQAGSDGSFLGAQYFAVPFDADITKGGADITAVGQQSKAIASAWFKLLPLEPSAELNSYEGPTGVTLHFSGNGFALGEEVIIALSGGTDILASARTDAEGNFSTVGNYVVPAGADGVLEFVFTGLQSRAEARTHYRLAAAGSEPGGEAGGVASPTPLTTPGP